ncbi:MAG: DUF1801 domain-containing protein [Chitinophagaceae bacterium]|nr:DUF1801 domain-containing protein [Chitinophagaceae bacterium]
MSTAATTISEYIAQLPDERKAVITSLQKAINAHLPKGFEETMSYGMIGYVVPHSLYPAGYHCNPSLPLPFLSIASQKNFVSLYHMGIYADAALMDWFVAAYPKHCKQKLDMGKSCIRFKKMEDVPYALIGELAAKMSPQQWIALYEKAFVK